jgi:LysR family nitrogen assimilation transcriptional regulator
MAVTLVQINHFVAVARAGSFSTAARSLDLAQSAVSQSIAALERELGVQLLARTSRTCRLTPLGEEFLADAERIAKDVDAATHRMRRAAQHGDHRLVLGLTGGLSGLVTERLLNAAKGGTTGLDLTIMEGSVGRLRELLLEGRIDCALTYGVPDNDPQLKARPIAFEPMHLIAHPEIMHRFLRPGPVDLRQVARFPLFLPSIAREAGAGQLLAREAEKSRITLDIRYELQSTSVIRRLLMQDKLATVIGLGAVADDVASGDLAARVVELKAFARPVCLAMTASRAFGPAEARLYERICEIADEFLLPCGLWRREQENYEAPSFMLFKQLR